MGISRYITITLTLGAVTFADAQHVVFPAINDLKGSARSMVEEVYTAVDKQGKVERGSELSKVQYLFGTKKNLMERDSYDGDGDILDRYATNYDDNGNIIEETEYNSDSLQNRYTYRYDGKGNEIGWMSYTVADTEPARGSYQYDDKGRITFDSLFDAKGKVLKWAAYTYDDQGHVTKEAHYSAKGDESVDNYVYDMDGKKIQDTRTGFDGSTLSISKFKYNDDDKLTAIDILTDSGSDYIPAERLKYDAKGNKTQDIKYSGSAISAKEEFKYDGDGNLIEDARYKGDGKLDVKYAYQYDASKNRTEYVIYRSDTTAFEKWTYKYDAQGNKTEECFYKSVPQEDGIAMKLELEYDKNGNWVRETGFKDQEPISLAVRQIVYY